MKGEIKSKNDEKKTWIIHELCMEFPWFDEEHQQIMNESITNVGLIDPIKRFQNEILDGKNRLRTIVNLGWEDNKIEKSIMDLPEDTNPVAFVRAEGLSRRDLSPTNRVLIAKKLDEYEQKLLSKGEKSKIEKWKKDPEKKKILEKKRIDRIKGTAKTTEKIVQQVFDVEKKAKKDPKSKKILEDMIENKISVSNGHKKAIGTTKKKKPKTKEPTRDQLIEDLTWYKYEVKRLTNINTRLIQFIKTKELWDEIKGEFNIMSDEKSAEPTPKQLREAELA